MSLILRRREMMSSGELPSGYTRLEYLEKDSKDRRYIDTGVPTSSTLLIKCTVMTYDKISTNGNEYGCVFGARESSGIDEIQLTTFESYGLHYSGTIRLGTKAYNAFISPNELYQLEIGIDYYKVNGVVYSADARTITSSYNICIFALRNSNTIVQHGHGRIYSFEMWDNGVKLRNFVPCINPSNVQGLYDTVNKEFYTFL